jgi:hypothetical protein
MAWIRHPIATGASALNLPCLWRILSRCGRLVPPESSEGRFRATTKELGKAARPLLYN